jgi:nitrate reductase gamma subunit
MNASTWTMVVGGVAGFGLAVFGAGMLITGRAPDATRRAFRSVRDAGCYHLLFGVGLAMIVFGTALGGGPVTLLTTVVAIAVVAVAVIRFRPRGRGDRWMGNRRPGDRNG